MNERLEKTPFELLKEDVQRLKADVRVAAASTEECDFLVYKDPKSWDGESYVGAKVSRVESLSYLRKLENLLDWQASQDEAVVGDGDEAKKKRKYAVYKRLDAAKIRRIVNLRFSDERARGPANSHSVSDDGLPF